MDLTSATWTAIGGDPGALDRLAPPGAPTGALPSSFAVEYFGTAALACVGLAVAELTDAPQVRVDGPAAAAALRSEQGLRIGDEDPESVWDPLSRVYAASDGAVRLHGNYAQHRAAIARRFGTTDPETVAAAIAGLTAAEVEASLHAAGGVAAAARTLGDWQAHPAGRAAAERALVTTEVRDDRRPTDGPRSTEADHQSRSERGPLAGLRVLELTRVIAGPVAGRTLSWFGADVVRVESPRHQELRTLIVDTGPGKRSVELDLKTPQGLSTFHELLAGADVLLRGLRPGALDALGLDRAQRAALAPGLIDASLSAYGHGPWLGRRGFDSLVQLSSGLGLAEAEAAGQADGLPRALPCQILDHATGLLLAAAIVRAVAARDADRRGRTITASLARTAAALAEAGRRPFSGEAPAPAAPGSLTLTGPHGTTRHAPVPVAVDGVGGGWQTGPPLVGQDDPVWA